MPADLRVADKVEILTLQDNYIEITAMDNSAVISRALPLKAGEFRVSVLAEHGFSALVKTTAGKETHTLLFDFGFSADGAAQNAKALGIDLTEVEAAALSHGHMDHTGGMQKLAALIGKKNIPLVVHPSVFKSPRYLKYSEEYRVNLPQLTREAVREAGLTAIESDKPYLLLDNTVLFLGEIPRRNDFEKGIPVAYWQKNGEEIRDAIEDDTSVVMHLKNKGLVILSGCAHAGIINTVKYAIEATGIDKIHAVMGGFHLSGPLFEPIIGRTVAELRKFHPDYVIPAHCTGRKAVLAVEREMPEKFLLNMAGTKLTFV